MIVVILLQVVILYRVNLSKHKTMAVPRNLSGAILNAAKITAGIPERIPPSYEVTSSDSMPRTTGYRNPQQRAREYERTNEAKLRNDAKRTEMMRP